MSKTAYFAGSFNPFTIGHADIVRRALTIFDHVIIGVGYNINKPTSRHDADGRVATIAAIYADDSRVRVEAYATLTANAARNAGADVLIRGVRDTRDFEYERQLAQVNRQLFDIETILLPADPNLSVLSSSMVRELAAYDVDISQFIPK